MKAGYVAAALLISFAASLIGPALFFASRSIGGGPGAQALCADLVFLLWPAQVFGVVEHGYGRLVAWLVTVGANALLFMLIGGSALFASKSAFHSILFASLVLIGLFLFAMWGSGFDSRYMNIPALAIAAVFYLVLISSSMMLGYRGRLS